MRSKERATNIPNFIALIWIGQSPFSMLLGIDEWNPTIVKRVIKSWAYPIEVPAVRYKNTVTCSLFNQHEL